MSVTFMYYGEKTHNTQKKNEGNEQSFETFANNIFVFYFYPISFF